jgi:hyperosmotically inducible periplasmic protein
MYALPASHRARTMEAIARIRRHRRWRRVFALVVFMVVLSGCASTRDPWEDARIESEVKAGLVAQHDANLTRLGVVSKQATVYLSGSVESAEQKSLAESVAKEVRGVKRVVSSLDVRARRQ